MRGCSSHTQFSREVAHSILNVAKEMLISDLIEHKKCSAQAQDNKAESQKIEYIQQHNCHLSSFKPSKP